MATNANLQFKLQFHHQSHQKEKKPKLTNDHTSLCEYFSHKLIQALRKSEEMLEEDTLEFDAFLKKNDEMVIAPTLIFD